MRFDLLVEVFRRNNRLARSGGADHKIGTDQRRIELAPVLGFAFPSLSQFLGAFGAAIDHGDVGGLLVAEITQGFVAHFSGADYQHALVG